MSKTYKVSPPVGSIIVPKPILNEKELRDFAKQIMSEEEMSEVWQEKIDKDEIQQDYASMDRYWRKALKENPELRGGDYGDKDDLELNKIGELGYSEPGEGLRKIIEADDRKES